MLEKSTSRMDKCNSKGDSIRIFLLILINMCCYISTTAQFFGTGSSRLDDAHDDDVLREMAQEYKEIIEDKE